MSFIDTFLRLFFPEQCPHCGEAIDIRENSCPDCRDNFEKIGRDYCINCGYSEERCVCEDGSIRLNHISAVYIYSGYVKSEIRDFKFCGNIKTGRKLGEEMAFRAAETIYGVTFDSVTFVPISEKGFRARGYNQSEILAQTVAEKLFVPCEELLCKKKDTAKQHELSGRERRLNVNGAFSLKDGISVKGKRILLCDDVKTTGATLKECEKVLLMSGAKEVYCLCIALADYGDTFAILDKKR